MNNQTQQSPAARQLAPCAPEKENSASAQAPRTELTKQQKQVVRLVFLAKKNGEIASALGLTTGTVKEYLFHIFKKLEVANRTALALWAKNHPEEAGLTELNVMPNQTVIPNGAEKPL